MNAADKAPATRGNGTASEAMAATKDETSGEETAATAVATDGVSGASCAGLSPLAGLVLVNPAFSYRQTAGPDLWTYIRYAFYYSIKDDVSREYEEYGE